MESTVEKSISKTSLISCMNHLLLGETNADAIEENLVESTAKTEVDCEIKNLSSSTTASLWLWYMKFFDLLKKIYLRLGTLPTRTFIFQFSLRYCHTKQHLETDCT